VPVPQSFPMHSSNFHPHPHMASGIDPKLVPTMNLSISPIKISQQRLSRSAEIPTMNLNVSSIKVPQQRLSHSAKDLAGSSSSSQRLGHSVEGLVCSSGSRACVQPQSRPLTHYGEPLTNPQSLIGTCSQSQQSPQTGYSYHSLPQPTGIPQFQMIRGSPPLYGYPPVSQGGILHPGYFHPQYPYHH
jgi:hypothetical protein